MCLHAFFDDFGIRVGARLTGHRYFSQDMESRRIPQLLSEISVMVPEIPDEGYCVIPVEHEGTSYEAGFRVEQWRGDGYPTILYHHGAAEGSYDFSFNRILGKNKERIPANLIAIRALFCDSNQVFFENVSYLSRYSLLLASSTLVVEGLIRRLREKSSRKITVTGVSLGGFVTNLHLTYFSTADSYKPLLAGARLGDVFLDSSYARVTAETAKKHPDILRDTLNFHEDFIQADRKNLFPLLAVHDRIVRYGVQLADYPEENVHSIPFGHATGALQFTRLREHILKDLTDQKEGPDHETR